MSPMMPPGMMGGMPPPPMMPPGMDMGMGGMPPGMPMPPGMNTPPSAGAFGPVGGPVDVSALLQALLPLLMGMGGGGVPGMPGMGMPPGMMGGMPTVPPQAPVPGLPPAGMAPPAGGPPLY